MNIFAVRLAHSVRRVLPALGLLAASMTAGGDARAQGGIDLSTENVTVDLSVLDDRGGRPASGPGYVAGPRAGAGGGLIVPDRRPPVSQLHVTVPPSSAKDRIKLRPPSAKKKKPAPRRAARKPAAPTAPAPKTAPPKPAVAAAQPPAPLTTPPPAPADAAPPAAKTAASAPPAPPPAAMPAKEPAPSAPAPAAAKATPEAKEQASLPPSEPALKPGRALLVKFDATASKLPPEFKDGLKALAGNMKDKDNLRLQLLAYAGSKGLSSSKARRLSLSRALSVRSFLIENGVRSTRIDVRALGNKTSEEPLNRVDVNIVER